MSNLFELAKQIAAVAHDGQTDKAGQPYINHPIAVADKVSSDTEKVVALMHDVIEDSATTLDDIRKAGFSEDIIEALDCITKRDNEAYDDYLLRVASNGIAKTVKMADIAHNMDTTRLINITEKDLKRLQKYEYAISVLSAP